MEGRVKGAAPARRGSSRIRPIEASPLPAALVRLRDAARDGTYFECLGLARDATTTDVREAWQAVARDVAAMRADLAGDPEASAVLEEAARVAEDAFTVLSDPDLRLAYRRALLPAEGV